MAVSFENLANSDLFVDCVYEGGTSGNTGDDPISKLMMVGNMSGFRKLNRKDGSNLPAYVVLYTSMAELEWPDYLDMETGVFRYYGDNRKPGNNILNTKQGGNKLLEQVFSMLNSNNIKDIPPFFVFQKTGNRRDVKFLGLAVPGNPDISPDKDLVAFWRTVNNSRFQNYEAYFTILDTASEPISRKWLNSLIYDHYNLEYAPRVWKEYINKGRNGIIALKAAKNIVIPNKYSQLQSDNEGMLCLDIIRNHYKENPYGFERCSVDIVRKIDTNFESFTLTRPWRDGGRDATGLYSIGTSNNSPNYPVKFECSLEAKCYSPDNAVGVRQMSRLISRIKHRQFGIMVTTSYVDKQAYSEVVEDRHPILIITASDIASTLRTNSINSGNIESWLKDIDDRGKGIAEFII